MRFIKSNSKIKKALPILYQIMKSKKVSLSNAKEYIQGVQVSLYKSKTTQPYAFYKPISRLF